MSHFDPELKTYAENGLRSAQDWAAMGRQLKDGTQPRTQTVHRRTTIALYGRDQTEMLPKPAAAAPVIQPPATPV